VTQFRRLSFAAAAVAAALSIAATALAKPASQRHAPAPLDGGALYRRNCSPCHGMDGSGNGPNASLFTLRPRNLHEGFLDAYSTEDLVRRIRDGRPLELALDKPALYRRAEQVDDIARYLETLPTVDWEAVGLGWSIYMTRCETCHGPFGEPPELTAAARRPPDFRDPRFQKSISDRELLMAVVHGRKGMPALTPRLNPAEAVEALSYVRHLSPGFQLYTEYCAVCHGDDGRGADSFGEAFPAPGVVFDRDYFRRTSPEDLRAAVWHMAQMQVPSMPHFRDVLTENETRAIVEFLKEREKLHRKED